MFSWRITKYNPAFRNSVGAYLKNDWIAVCDIGKTFDIKILTLVWFYMEVLRLLGKVRKK